MSQNPFLKNFKFSIFSFPQWKKLYNLLSETERKLILLFSMLALVSLVFLTAKFYFKNTEIKPAVGGSFIEGIVGQPSFINPLFSESSDVDRDLTEILFSGLMKYDKNGKIAKDLAEKVEIKENGKIYEFSIKDDILWSDGKKLTVDDKILTIQAIKSQTKKSP
jgi:ABC-type transport system substrate-binding protein